MPNPYYNPYWLEHYGVKGQSWGKKNGPPYPLSRGKDGRVTQTQKKKKQSLIARMKADHQEKVKAKQRAKARAEKKKETLSNAELREKLLKSTDPKFIAQHMDLLDTKEIKDRLDRIDTERKIKNLTKDDKAKKYIENGMKWVDHISKIAETTSKTAKAYNDVLESAAKKDKLADEKAKRKAETVMVTESVKAAQRSMGDASTAMSELVKEYGKNASAFGNIQMEFDAKTGKLTFKPSGGGGEGKKKRKRNN